jgi:hypothetical protein
MMDMPPINTIARTASVPQSRGRRRLRIWLVLLCVLTAQEMIFPRAGLAAGGPYVVDDSEIMPPGDCQIEAWGSRGHTHDLSAVASPACSVEAPLDVELGLAWNRTRTDGVYASTISPNAKASLLRIDRHGIGLGLAGAFGYSTTEDRLLTAALLVPLTVQALEPLRLNFNVGWLRERADETLDFLTLGAGFEWSVFERLALIGEVFGRDRGRGGAPIGLRPTVIKDVLDLDIVYGRNLDQMRSDWLTLGMVVNF